MYIKVKLLQAYTEPLLYSCPDEWASDKLIGSIVMVPLRTTKVHGFVTATYNEKPPCNRAFTIKQALSIEPFPHDIHYLPFIKQLATYYQVDELFFIKRIKHFLGQKEVLLDSCFSSIDVHNKYDYRNVILTQKQQFIVDSIVPHITAPCYAPALLHGVTGSGKTEVYKKLIQTTLDSGETAIFLLPEVTLAMQFSTLLRKQLPPSIEIRSFHSATGVKEKKQTWSMLINEHPILLIGVHLPILLPIANLGLIIVDEEHDIGYQEKKHPKINSKEAAIWRAHQYHIPIVLGSATPSCSSLHNVHTKNWKLYTLTQRFSGAFPTIQRVLLSNKHKRKNFWISTELQEAIADRLAKKEQTIIFLNRRGDSFFIQCSACNYIPTCKACAVSLTLHEEGYLNCHYCGYTIPLPTQCPTCKADGSCLNKRGIGTQQVVKILKALFPYARIGRADMDTTTKKREWEQTVTDFEQGNIDILVGTQTITKGFHFPRVTLVGILWADINLNFPLYNASETTLQQIIQVAGRAGRQSDKSLVIVQAMEDHDIFSYLHEIDYIQFYDKEIQSRQELQYPPCARLVEIELKHMQEYTVETESHIFATFLLTQANRYPSMRILGPTKPPVSKIKNIHTRKIYIKGYNIHEILNILKHKEDLRITSSIHICPNPLS
jgi:primosomal protein N' (replication factor Y)